MFRKKIYIIVALTMCSSIALSACNKVKGVQSSNGVSDIIESQISSQSESPETESSEILENVSKNSEESLVNPLITELKPSNTEGIDYDLTTMEGDMVYASVYQMMVDPEEFEGKTVKISGKYYASFYEPNNKYYHYVIIEDAAACCAQGMEFIWDDGSHIYPDEYPKNDSYVEVVGTFESYEEEGDGRLYCRLKESTFKVISQ